MNTHQKLTDWIKKMRCIHRIQYYWAFKKMDILQYGTTWMSLENIMLSEVITERQMLHEVSKVVRLIGAESRMVVARDWGRWKQGVAM